MNSELIFFSLIFLFGTFISSISQVLLKKAAMRTYPSKIKEYVNPLVIGAYSIFLIATLTTVLAYRVVPLSLGPILEATSYFYITFFGVWLFKERIDRRKIVALLLIVSGILLYSISI